MKKSIMTIGTLVLVVAALSLGSCRHGRGDHDSAEKAEWAISYIDYKLDLSDDQEDEMTQVKDEVVAKIKEMKGQKQASHAKVVALVREDRVNADSINALIDERLAAFEKIRPFMVSKVVQVFSILTNEQKNKLADIAEEHHNNE